MNVSSVRTLSAVFALTVFSALSATAESPLHLRNPFHRTPSSVVKPQSITVAFRNASPQQRELQVGNRRVPVAGFQSARLYLTVGDQVKVYSAVNSRIDGATILTVTPDSVGHEVVVN